MIDEIRGMIDAGDRELEKMHHDAAEFGYVKAMAQADWTILTTARAAQEALAQLDMGRAPVQVGYTLLDGARHVALAAARREGGARRVGVAMDLEMARAYAALAQQLLR